MGSMRPPSRSRIDRVVTRSGRGIARCSFVADAAAHVAKLVVLGARPTLVVVATPAVGRNDGGSVVVIADDPWLLLEHAARSKATTTSEPMLTSRRAI